MIDPGDMAADFNRDQKTETLSRVPVGLTDSEVQARRAQGLGNVLPAPTGRTYLEILRENVFTFINNVLFGLGFALVLLGHWTDALVSVGVVCVNLVVGVVQEVRAKRILDRIALLTRPRATVIRDGREVSVDPGEVVLGDVLVVRPGDQVVVDGEVIGDGHFDLDESLLTGESDLVTKTAGDPVYAGSYCMSGHGYFAAQKVGAESLANQLTARARSFRRVYTPLQREINLTVRIILLVAVSFGIVLVIDAIIEQIALAESVKMAVVVAGLVPNGLFLAIAVAYTMGAVRIARRRVLVQQANAVESLSHVTVLCLDKTGTLTTGRLGFHALYAFDAGKEQVERWLGDFARSTEAGNRTTAAIATVFPGEPRSIRDEVSFSSERKWSALTFADPALSGTFVLGAPEVLLPRLNSSRVDDVMAKVAEWASAGFRVVLFARGTGEGVPRDTADQPVLPAELVPVALVSFRDELRPDTRDTLAGFEAAGVQLKIFSGDDPRTTRAVAIQAGFAPASRTRSGLDLVGTDPAQLATVAGETTIFGRLTPQQKQNLVHALQDDGQYVAFIGDGVNDVLALKQADLGIALSSGSQAASAVADMVLLDDGFAALPAAFREGQRILNGMQDVLRLFLTRVLYVALLILAIEFVDAGFPLSPKLNALLTLLTVGIPTIALAAWARPIPPARDALLKSLLQFVLPAAWSLAVVGFAVYLAYFLPSRDEILRAAPGAARLSALQAAQTVAQSALTTVSVFCGLLLVLFSQRPAPAQGEMLRRDRRVWALVAVLLLGFVVVLAIPSARRFFDLTWLGLADYVVLGVVALVWAVGLYWSWRTRLFERALGLDDVRTLPR